MSYEFEYHDLLYHFENDTDFCDTSFSFRVPTNLAFTVF